MSLIDGVTQGIRHRRNESPRTVLAFAATVLGLALAGDVGAVGVLAGTGVSTYLIPWLLGFAALLVVALLVTVFLIALRDPSKLMLGQVTGTEYVKIQSSLVRSSNTVELDLTQRRARELGSQVE